MLVVGVTLFVIGALCVLANTGTVVAMAITRGSTSVIPPIGGLLALIGASLVPAIGWRLGLIALALDIGTWAIVWWVVEVLRERLRRRRDRVRVTVVKRRRT